MNINRHNYESFFLLYIDNELSVPERNALESFVKENDDLQEELDMLKQSVLKADDIVFKGKSKLFKPETILAEREAQLLLYLDGELPAEEAEELETVLVNDNSLATQLQLLQQTKLSPADTIVFANKELLYRKEENRVIPFGWWKLAAAAVFIGFGIWGTALYFDSKTTITPNEMAGTKGLKPTESTRSIPALTPAAETAVATVPTPEIKESGLPKSIVKSVAPAKIKEAVEKEYKTVAVDQEIKGKPDNHLPKPYFENNNNNESNKTALASVLPETLQTKINSVVNTVKESKVQPVVSDNNVYTTAFTEKSDENKEDRFVLSEDKPKKSKLTGFLRKAKRVLERNTEMKPGDNNVKVANLEFAIQ